MSTVQRLVQKISKTVFARWYYLPASADFCPLFSFSLFTFGSACNTSLRLSESHLCNSRLHPHTPEPESVPKKIASFSVAPKSRCSTSRAVSSYTIMSGNQQLMSPMGSVSSSAGSGSPSPMSSFDHLSDEELAQISVRQLNQKLMVRV